MMAAQLGDLKAFRAAADCAPVSFTVQTNSARKAEPIKGSPADFDVVAGGRPACRHVRGRTGSKSSRSRSLLIAERTRPPTNPASAIKKAIAAASRTLKGESRHSEAPSALAQRMPPANPPTVFDGDSTGAIVCRPNSFPQMYCRTSLASAIKTRKTRSNVRRFWWSGICRVVPTKRT
jgi:hypothetical protein